MLLRAAILRFAFRLLDWIGIAWAAVLAAAAAFLMLMGTRLAGDAALSHSSDTYVLIVPLFFLFGIACTVIHELGHAAGARIVGWQVHAIAVRGYVYRIRQRKFDREIGERDAHTAGWVLSTPRPDQDWNRAWPAIIFAGPLANLLAGAVAVAISIPLDRTGHALGLAGFLAGFALCNLTVGIFNLIPFRAPGSKWSDGGKLVAALIGYEIAEFAQLASAIKGMQLDGVDAKDWHPSVMQRFEVASFPPTLEPVRETCLIQYYLAHGGVRRIKAIVERSENLRDSKASPVLELKAFLACIVERDAEKALKLLDAIPPPARKGFSYLRALAVAQAMHGEPDLARETVKAALVADGNPDQDDRALFDAIREDRPIPHEFRERPAA